MIGYLHQITCCKATILFDEDTYFSSKKDVVAFTLFNGPKHIDKGVVRLQIPQLLKLL